MLVPRPVEELDKRPERLARLLGHYLQRSPHSIVIATLEISKEVILSIVILEDDLFYFLIKLD